MLLPARLVFALLLSVGLGVGVLPDARAQEGVPEEEPEGSQAVQPAQEMTPQILYQLMLAEVAAARGQTVLAAQSYLDLARSTRDGRVARRAAEMALFSRDAELASEASRLWLEIDPASVKAQQLASGALAAHARLDELKAQLGKALASQGDKTGPALLGLNRGLARIPDKALIRRLVVELTEPYLNLPEAHFARANAAFVAGEPGAASLALDGALALRPDWEQAVLLKAQFLHEAEAGQGVPLLRRYLDAHPDAREPRLALARMLAAGREFGMSRKEFERLVARDPADRDALHAAGLLALQAGDSSVAERHFRRLLALGFPDAETLRMYLGQIAQDGKRSEEALEWYRAVGPGTQFVPAQSRIAQVLADQGRLAEARAHFQEVARVSPPGERSQFVLAEAQLLRDAGQQAAATQVLEEALRGEPDNPEFLYESALMAERAGQPDVMEGRLRKLIALKPDHAHAYNALGYSLAERNQRIDEAEVLIRQGLALAPEDPFISDSLGWVLYRKGDLKGALEWLQKAYGLRADPEIAAHLGEVQWMLGRRDDAAKTWREAAKAHPGNAALADVMRKFKP
ncbi:MAG: tetratricopeptide repeat protein [Zoogloea sp.]|nr:tetratricopeptide repeat protein [Zoogloea sp.]MDD3354745.1 tetratricopeptide repeat protein [Zoogloea sp.]